MTKRQHREDVLTQNPAGLDTHALTFLAQGIYNELSKVSSIAAASLGQHVNAGKPGHKILHAVEEAPHDWFRRRFIGCRTDDSRRAVIRDGQAELKALRYSRRPSIDLGTQEGRLEVGRDTRPPKVKAVVYDVPLSTVYHWEKQAEKKDADRAALRRRWAA